LKKSRQISKTLVLAILVLILLGSYPNLPPTRAVKLSNLSYSVEGENIRVTMNDIELLFNATNGGEITEYYDLSADPNRNLANMSLIQSPLRPLCSLTNSVLYLTREECYGTGFDTNADVRVAGSSSNYVILQTSSELINKAGRIAKDLGGSAIHIDSTWLFLSDGHVFLERIFSASNGANLSGWFWYPLYMTRTLGFDNTATFYMFNTTDAFASTLDWETLEYYNNAPVFPNDTNSIFGIAAPFSNTSLGGDGGHNIILTYKYNELGIKEWKSDNYNGNLWQTGFGAKYRFEKNTEIFTHKFYATIHFTHQDISERDTVEYAQQFKDITAFPLFSCNITTNKQVLHRGDLIQVFVSGKSYYALNLLKAKLIVKNSYGETILLQNYGPFNAPENFSFTNHLLMNEIVSQNAKYNNYTLTFQILTPLSMVIAQNSTMITVTGYG
jgi:hypothetical protein